MGQRFNRAITLLFLAGLFASNGTAQKVDSSDQSLPIFRSQTELVLVPVIVTDKKGNSVGGLKADDFKLMENGKQRKIASFDEITTTAALPDALPGPANEFTNQMDTSKNGRITIILLDLLNTAFSEQVRVRRDSLKFVSEHLEPGEPIALMSLGPEGIRVLHDFTTNPQELAEALKKVVPRRSVSENLSQEEPYPTMPMTLNRNVQMIIGTLQSFENVDSGEGDALEAKNLAGLPGMTQRIIPQAFRNQQEFQKRSAFELTLRTMRVIADAFAGIPGRKSLIWASAGIPDLAVAPNSTQVFRSEYELYEATWAALSDANIAVYPLDLSTLTTERYTDPSHEYPIGPLRTMSTPVTNLEEFAKRTGGRLCIAKMDMENCFQTAARDASHYYQLAYYADPKGGEGWRKIAVQMLNHPDVAIQARNGYFYHRNEKTDPTRNVDIQIAMASPLNSNAVPMRLKWVDQVKNGDKTKVDFEVWLPAVATTIDRSQKNHVSFTILGLAKTITGKLEDSFEQEVNGDLPDNVVSEIQRQGISQTGSFSLPAGDYAVRFVVRDSLTGKVGSVTAPVKVGKQGS